MIYFCFTLIGRVIIFPFQERVLRCCFWICSDIKSQSCFVAFKKEASQEFGGMLSMFGVMLTKSIESDECLEKVIRNSDIVLNQMSILTDGYVMFETVKVLIWSSLFSLSFLNLVWVVESLSPWGWTIAPS